MSKSLFNPLSHQFGHQMNRLAVAARMVLSDAFQSRREAMQRRQISTASAGQSTLVGVALSMVADVKTLSSNLRRHSSGVGGDKKTRDLLNDLRRTVARLEEQKRKVEELAAKLNKREQELKDERALAEKIYQEYEKKFLEHPLIDNKNKFFTEVLERFAKEGISMQEAKIIIENFKARTENTIRSVLASANHALKEHDMEAIAAAGKNFGEEAGNGNPKMVHLQLLEDCFNMYFAKMFGAEFDLASIFDAKDSPCITEKTKAFSQLQNQMSDLQKPYIEAFAFFTAHEFFAERMLRQIFEKMFEPFKERFGEDEYKQMVLYFSVHLDEGKDGKPSVEQEHYLKAKEAAIRVIAANLENEQLFGTGGLHNLNAQHAMFESIAEAASKVRDESKLVLPDAVVKKMVEKAASLPKTGTSKSPQDPEAEPLQPKSQQHDGREE